MSDVSEISAIERAYFEIQRIRKELDALEDFLLSELKQNREAKPRSDGIVDPRTGKLFRQNKN